MVSKMGQELEKMSVEKRHRISSEMFDSIDGNGTQTIDFKEFFNFYQDHLAKLVYEEDLQHYNPEIQSEKLARWRKIVNGMCTTQ